ncbi:MAG TPA: undecaprenyl-diphosphate phosphatase [Cyclobacteriaceae bacterium]|jgi:undecaprenyl-diphosphatase|nr:undecaprenyl-diphosphate phosphatase [Cyclobacteriaceae bacterium]
MSVFQSIILAIVEGLTEFLPVSSTGHMIIVSSLMGIASDSFTKTFTVAIQLGAILSVVVLYWKRFFVSFSFYYKLLVAFIPAAVLGLLFNDYIDALLERVEVVAITLILGGVVFIFIDKIFKDTEEKENNEVTYSKALKIGFFQTIAMIPGVSRSAATIIGGMTQKLNKRTAAEFSFFLAVPTMFAATAYKLLKFYQEGNSFGTNEVVLLLVGNVVAFIVAMFAIKSFITFLTRHGFKWFGYYRIIVGILILVLFFLDVELSVL